MIVLRQRSEFLGRTLSAERQAYLRHAYFVPGFSTQKSHDGAHQVDAEVEVRHIRKQSAHALECDLGQFALSYYILFNSAIFDMIIIGNCTFYLSI